MKMGKKTYTSFNLPTDLVQELKVWRQAFILSYGRTVSYGEMIRTMLDHLDTDEPDVTRAMDMLTNAHPELAEKLGKYKGAESDDNEIKA